jgi:hypothetical protein
MKDSLVRNTNGLPNIQMRSAAMMKHKVLLIVLLGLAVPFIFASGDAWAVVQYLNDGAVQNSQGGFNLPPQGSCPAAGTYSYTGIDTRPECVALRLNVIQASCTGNLTWTTNGVCNDLIHTTQGTCEGTPDRLWNPSTGLCSIVMLDDDRNNVSCALHQGTWVTSGTCTGNWIMPAGNTYVPPLLGTGTGPGDQCLRCHNTRTQYNSPRVRDTEDTLFMGHKNMSRKVVPGTGWGGPTFHCLGAAGTAEEQCYDNGGNWVPEALYPSTDTGQDFDWVNGQVDIDPTAGVNKKNLFWIFGDWLSALPRAIYSADPNTAPNPDTPGLSYSCARCHTTGWNSDATINYGVGLTAATSTREPEKSFNGITWDGVSNAVTGQVNFAGGITGDTNKMASWDNFGIVCTRCHSSAIERTSTAPSGFSAPVGMSSHHSDLTAVDVSTTSLGYCTDTRFTAQAQCDANGGGWLTACSVAGVCSNPAFGTSGECAAGGGVWTVYGTQSACLTNGGTWYGTGCIGDATLTTQATCQGAGKVWFGPGCSNATFTSQTTCESNSAVWSDSRCTVSGVCNNPLYTDAITCKANGAQWQATTDIIRCDDAGGRWTGSKTQRGQTITALCMNCHRQETGGKPNDSGSNPAQLIKVGPVHGTVDFGLHFHGNQFLNSPHAEFSGAFTKIATGKASAEYQSDFMNFAEAAKTGNGCTGCHEVHTSTVTGEEPFRETCVDCHSSPEHASDIPQVNLATINHLSGVGTPLEHAGTEPAEACITCHMPGGQHLWRINPSAAYSTFPSNAVTSTVNANTAPAGSYTNAVWIDVDAACGQCHGGGTSQKTTTGSITASSANLTVASSTGFLVGQKIRIIGAGSLYYDDSGVSKLYSDFDSYVKLVPDATHITLAGNATTTVNSVAVTQNATKNNALYRTKTTLAQVALGMHGSAGVNYPVTFSIAIGNPNTLQIHVDATVNCGGSCPTFTYDWDWGDGSAHGTADPDTHAYLSSGSKTIKLVVKWNGKEVGSSTRSVTLTNPDLAPTASATCTPSPNTWGMSVLDASQDDGPDADTANDISPTLTISVDWGDGSVKSSGARGATFNHTYTKTGTFTVNVKAQDAKLQSNTYTCSALTLNYFNITGTITQSNGTTAVGSASVSILQGSTTIKTVITAANGTFTAGSLKPGTYSIKVTKTGYTFPTPNTVNNPNVTIGPSKTAGVSDKIKAITP